MTKSLRLNYLTFNITQIVNHLFGGTGLKHGLDLTSLNVQRGRDHGLPGYIEYAQKCSKAAFDEDITITEFQVCGIRNNSQIPIP